MPLFYCRHGKTDWNEKNLVQGRVDVPLNDIGRQQAEEARSSLTDLHIDSAYCSPLQRTKETAKILLEGKNIPCREDPRLLEIYYGEQEGKDRREEDFLSCKKSYFKRFPQGESYFDAVARIYSFLHELESRCPEDNVLVVAHGGISRIVHSYFYDMENEEFENRIIGNCEIVRYDWPQRDFPLSLPIEAKRP